MWAIISTLGHHKNVMIILKLISFVISLPFSLSLCLVPSVFYAQITKKNSLKMKRNAQRKEKYFINTLFQWRSILFLNVAEAERQANFLEPVEVGKWAAIGTGGGGRLDEPGRGPERYAFGACWHISNNEWEINLKFFLFPRFPFPRALIVQ